MCESHMENNGITNINVRFMKRIKIDSLDFPFGIQFTKAKRQKKKLFSRKYMFLACKSARSMNRERKQKRRKKNNFVLYSVPIVLHFYLVTPTMLTSFCY